MLKDMDTKDPKPPVSRRTAVWQLIYGIFLLVIIVLSTGTFIYEHLLDREPTATESLIFDIILYSVSGIFLIEYIVRFIHAENKLRYFIYRIPMLIVIFAPFLRFLLLGQVFRLFYIVRLAASARVAFRMFSQLRDSIGRYEVFYVGTALLVIITFGSLLMYTFERDVNPDIVELEHAIWFVIVTMSTVGYGDIYPVSIEGKITAVVIIFFGVAFFGYLGAQIISFFVERRTKRALAESEAEEAETFEKKVLEELAFLHREVQALRQDAEAKPDEAKPQ